MKFSIAASSLIALSSASSCSNTAFGATDLTNDGCEWYDTFPNSCGDWDDDDFTASSMCCACDGGFTAVEACQDTNEGLGDSFGDKCDWYENNPGNCSGYYDTANFKVESMCCECGGGNDLCYDSPNAGGDTYGDGCDWYVGNEAWCGAYDHADFIASAVCCAC